MGVGAVSKEKAVTVQEADLDVQERNWLVYIAGGLFSKVKKTKDKRYYIVVYKKETRRTISNIINE